MEGLGHWWQQLGWRETGVKIKGTNIIWSFHAAWHCLGTILANPSRPRSRQSCTCGVRSLDQGSAQIFHKEPDRKYSRLEHRHKEAYGPGQTR